MFDKIKYLGLAALTAGPVAFCSDPVTLPDVGQDSLAQYLTTGITTIAGVVAVAIGGYVAFKLVKKALRWVNTALG